jgi:uncharacterized protein (TIGR02996 family)
MSSLRDALEAALVEDPDDLATHRAYADYLQEQGDPRGEFIQVQLALEDPERTPEERWELERRERALMAKLSCGGLGDFVEAVSQLLEEGSKALEIRFSRGWLDRFALRYTGHLLARELACLLAQSPASHLLRELVFGCDEGSVKQLIRSPFLSNLQVFHLGTPESDFGEASQWAIQSIAVPELVVKLPRIEELHLNAWGYNPASLFVLPNLTRLRVLKIYSLEKRYPLELIAGNPSLGNLIYLLLQPVTSPVPLIDLAGVRTVIQSPHLRSLTHLQLRRSDLGDVGCTEIVTSGILKRLKVLDLRHGEITDAGARILADCPDLKHLECLDIGRNGLTQTGIDALRRILGDKLRADDQFTAEELAQRHYLDGADF